MRLVLAQVFRPEFVGRLVEVLGEVLHDSQVPFYGTLGVITTLEFLQHLFSKLGHRDLLVTHKISPPSSDGHYLCPRVASAAPAASFKRASVRGYGVHMGV